MGQDVRAPGWPPHNTAEALHQPRLDGPMVLQLGRPLRRGRGKAEAAVLVPRHSKHGAGWPARHSRQRPSALRCSRGGAHRRATRSAGSSRASKTIALRPGRSAMVRYVALPKKCSVAVKSVAGRGMRMMRYLGTVRKARVPRPARACLRVCERPSSSHDHGAFDQAYTGTTGPARAEGCSAGQSCRDRQPGRRARCRQQSPGAAERREQLAWLPPPTRGDSCPLGLKSHKMEALRSGGMPSLSWIASYVAE